LAIGLALFLYVLFKTLRFIFSAKQGRTVRTSRMFKVWLQRIVAATVVVFGLNYTCDVGLRSNAHDCHTEKSNKDGGLYTAELCFLDGNSDGYKMRLRLYSSSDGGLLADRTFFDMEPRLIWGVDRDLLIYNTSDNHGYISLPPSWMDRMRAKLP
jgi:hypothetical protein